jgi:hypothetical protein
MIMTRPVSLLIAVTGGLAVVTPAMAGTIDISQTAGGYRIQLKILPFEPIYTAQQAVAGDIKSGLLVVGGARPIAVNGRSHPNRRLVVSVVDEKTGRPDVDADVGLFLQPCDHYGTPTTELTSVPIVKTQEIGAGAGSTQYGNDVDLVSGRYRISVTANGMALTFFTNV